MDWDYTGLNPALSQENLVEQLGGNQALLQSLGYYGPTFTATDSGENAGLNKEVSPEFAKFLASIGGSVGGSVEGNNLIAYLYGPGGQVLGSQGQNLDASGDLLKFASVIGGGLAAGYGATALTGGAGTGAALGGGAVDLGTASGADLSAFYGGTDAGATLGSGAGAAAGGSAAAGGLGSSLTSLLTGKASLPQYAQLLASLYGLYQGNQLQSMAKNADPFGPYRAGFAQQLQQLMANPSSVTSLPGYQASMQAGEQSLTRNLASQGLTGSGTAASSLVNYGSQFEMQAFQQQLQNLMGLSGANINGAGTNMAGYAAGANTINQSLNNLVKLWGATPVGP